MRSEILRRRGPGFTAEAAIRPASRRYAGVAALPGATSAQAIGPSMIGRRAGQRPAIAMDDAITMTCSGSDAARCSATCDALGGGMSSNPSGTVSCTVY